MRSAYLQGLHGFSVQDERQRLRHLGIGMRRDGDLELQFGRRDDRDFELCAHVSLHGADDAPLGRDPRAMRSPAQSWDERRFPRRWPSTRHLPTCVRDKPVRAARRQSYADRHGTCATRTQSRRPRWRLVGHHCGVHLRPARTDAAVGALRGDRQRHQREAPQLASTSATRSSCRRRCRPPPTSPRPPTARMSS